MIFGHALLLSGARNPFAALEGLAALGVRIFFVISGFLITTLLLRELDSAGSIDLARFYARRTLRIFPASYAYIAVVAVLARAGMIALHPHDLAFAATYSTSYARSPSWWIGHLWSLSVEEQFYLLWPGVLLLAGRRWGQRLVWATILTGPLLRGLWWAALPGSRMLMGRAFPTVADALATGCLCAFRTDWIRAARRSQKSYLWIVVPSLIVLASLPQDELAPLVRRPLRLMFDTISNALIASLMLGTVTAESGLTYRLLNNRPMVALGMVSYSLYLWQQLFFGWPGTSVPLAVTAALMAAVLSYTLLERPLAGLRRRLHPVEPVPEPASAAGL